MNRSIIGFLLLLAGLNSSAMVPQQTTFSKEAKNALIERINALTLLDTGALSDTDLIDDIRTFAGTHAQTSLFQLGLVFSKKANASHKDIQLIHDAVNETITQSLQIVGGAPVRYDHAAASYSLLMQLLGKVAQLKKDAGI